MSFFASIKQNHIQALTALSDRKIEWRLVGTVLVLMTATLAVLYASPVFGFAEVIEPLLSKIQEITVTDPSFITVLSILFVGDALTELFGVFMWGYITMRILKYLKKPLPFVQIANIYLVTLVYEMVLGFAVLLATAGTVMITKSELVAVEQVGSGKEILVFGVSLFLVWVYIWSIRYAMNNRKHVMSNQINNNH